MAKKKKCFLDMEFTGLHKLTTPISLGIVTEDGKEYYAEFDDYDEHQVDDFVQKNVVSKLMLDGYDFEQHYDPKAETVFVKGGTELIKNTLTEWLEQYKEDGIEMWGDCLAYDWVLFTNIFGTAFDIPKHIYYLPMDICTALKLCGEDPDVDREKFAYSGEELEKSEADKHNSLADARTQLQVYKKILQKMSGAGNESLEAVNDEAKEESVKELPEVDNTVVEATQTTEKLPFIEPTQADLERSEEWNPPLG